MRPKTDIQPTTRWRAKARCQDKIESIPTIAGGIVRTITFAKPDMRENFLRTYQKQIREESKLKPALGFLLLLLILTPFAKADDIPLAPTAKPEASMPRPAVKGNAIRLSLTSK